jgi:glucose-6-phosphate 1-epimerase
MDSISMIAELDRRFGIPGVAKVCEGKGGLPRVQIDGALGQGEVYLHGAHVTSWKPAGPAGKMKCFS